MFTKQERYFLREVDPSSLQERFTAALGQRAMSLAPVGGGMLTSRGGVQSGVWPELTISLAPGPEGGQFVELKVKGHFEQSHMVILIVLLIFFWPVSLLLGYFSYQAFEREADAILGQLRPVIGPNAHRA